MSYASHQPIWLWQSLNVEYRFRGTCQDKFLLVMEKIFCCTCKSTIAFFSLRLIKKLWPTFFSVLNSCKQNKNQNIYSILKFCHNQIGSWHATDKKIESKCSRLRYLGSRNNFDVDIWFSIKSINFGLR